MSIPQSGGGPIEDFAQLAELLESGNKPKSDWRIGTEHEKFGWLTDTRAPLPYAGDRSISALFAGLQALRLDPCDRGRQHHRHDPRMAPTSAWNPAASSNSPARRWKTCTKAPPSCKTIWTRSAASPTRWASNSWASVLRRNGRPTTMPVMPKGRYRLMTDYMGRVGTHGTQMMYRTCTVQVNLDYASEADMVKKLRVALALQPVATALFASIALL